MSFPTQPVFVHTGDWDEESRKHPAVKWMEEYTKTQVDSRVWTDGKVMNDWHTSDFAYQRSDGGRREGVDKVNGALTEVYGPFSAHKHRPTFLLCWYAYSLLPDKQISHKHYRREDGNGWTIFGHAHVYVGFKGVEGTITDPDGDKWSAVMEAAFRFWYVKDESGKDGIKIQETRTYADPMPAIGFMLQKGIVSAKDLGLA